MNLGDIILILGLSYLAFLIIVLSMWVALFIFAIRLIKKHPIPALFIFIVIFAIGVTMIASGGFSVPGVTIVVAELIVLVSQYKNLKRALR